MIAPFASAWFLTSLFLTLSLAASAASAGLNNQNPGWIGSLGGGSEPAACETLEYEQTSNTSGRTLGDVTARTWKASVIAASELSSGFTMCRMTVELAPVGSPTQTITAYIFSNNNNSTPSDYTDDSPATLLATSTSTLSASSVTAQGWYEFTFAGLAMTASTDYWVVLKSSAVDASNHLLWMSTSAGVEEETRNSENGSAWSGDSSSRGLAVRLYSE